MDSNLGHCVLPRVLICTAFRRRRSKLLIYCSDYKCAHLDNDQQRPMAGVRSVIRH